MGSFPALHAKLMVWQANCPANSGDRAAPVAAEIAGLEGRELEAILVPLSQSAEELDQSRSPVRLAAMRTISA
jgi:hypothetical protein